MRGRLNLLTAGVTLLVVIAFVVPLGFLVRQQADQRGRLEAEREAQTLAAVLVRATAGAGTDVTAATVAGVVGPIPEGSALILPGGSTLGSGPVDTALVDEVLAASTALSAYTAEGYAVAIPVSTPAGMAVVSSSVASSELTEGVAGAWLLLGLLGIVIVAAALFVSDRLGRTVVGPSERIATAAERLGQGDLAVRVEEEGPEELVAIAESFNRLADRIRGLLAAEREQVADLSHRLRTPLSALRLQAEQLDPSAERDLLVSKVEAVGAAVDELIATARRDASEEPMLCDLIAVASERIRFWEVLAEEQERELHVALGGTGALIRARKGDAGAALDALLGNVFAHTDPGVAFGIVARVSDDRVEIEVTDAGPGFAPDADPTERGHSGAGSSGLGLDIVQRFASAAGGEMRLGSSQPRGARVVVDLPLTGAQSST